MIQQVVWRPDTCTCSLTFEVDSSLPADQQDIPGSGVVVAAIPCPDHATIVDGELLRQAVMSENITRQLTLHAVAYALGWQPEVRHPRVPSVVISPEVNPIFAPLTLPHGFAADRSLLIFTADLESDGADPAVIASAIANTPLPVVKKAVLVNRSIDQSTPAFFPAAADILATAQAEFLAVRGALTPAPHI